MRQDMTPRRDYSRLAARLFNTPLCVEPGIAEVYSAYLQLRMGVGSSDINAETLQARQLALAGDARRDYNDWKPHPVTENVAVIAVHDVLEHRGGLDPESGMTSYQGIARKMRSAREDPDVRAIWLDIDSPGGEVAGMQTLAEEMALGSASEGGKPVWAFVNERSASAAYWLASAADRVIAPRNGMIGSIGCIMMHVDQTARLAKEGFKPTLIRSGERKARTSSFEALDDEAIERQQSICDAVRDQFADFVGMGRRISKAGALATEAEMFTASEAMDLGLIDAIMPEREAWAELQRLIGRG